MDRDFSLYSYLSEIIYILPNCLKEENVFQYSTVVTFYPFICWPCKKKKRKENENVCNNIFETAIQIHFSNIGAKECFFSTVFLNFILVVMMRVMLLGIEKVWIYDWSLNACQSVPRHFVSPWIRLTLITQEKHIEDFLFYIQKICGVRKPFYGIEFLCFLRRKENITVFIKIMNRYDCL